MPLWHTNLQWQRFSHGEMWQASVPEVDPRGSVRIVSGKGHKEVVRPLFVSYEFGTYSLFWPVTFTLASIRINFRHCKPKNKSIISVCTSTWWLPSACFYHPWEQIGVWQLWTWICIGKIWEKVLALPLTYWVILGKILDGAFLFTLLNEYKNTSYL